MYDLIGESDGMYRGLFGWKRRSLERRSCDCPIFQHRSFPGVILRGLDL